MKAGDIVYDKLTGAAAVTAIVAQRVYPIDAPLDVDLPCLWYDVSLTEAVEGSAPLSTAQVQVGCVAHSEATAHSLAAAVHAVLNGLTATDTGTWLRSLTQMGRTESRDPDNNLWGVLLVYGASVTF